MKALFIIVTLLASQAVLAQPNCEAEIYENSKLVVKQKITSGFDVEGKLKLGDEIEDKFFATYSANTKEMLLQILDAGREFQNGVSASFPVGPAQLKAYEGKRAYILTCK